MKTETEIRERKLTLINERDELGNMISKDYSLVLNAKIAVIGWVLNGKRDW